MLCPIGTDQCRDRSELHSKFTRQSLSLHWIYAICYALLWIWKQSGLWVRHGVHWKSFKFHRMLTLSQWGSQRGLPPSLEGSISVHLKLRAQWRSHWWAKKQVCQIRQLSTLPLGKLDWTEEARNRARVGKGHTPYSTVVILKKEVGLQESSNINHVNHCQIRREKSYWKTFPSWSHFCTSRDKVRFLSNWEGMELVCAIQVRKL